NVPVHAPVWGLGRVLAQEHPEARCVLVDLDGGSGAPGEEAHMLSDELLAAKGADEVAFRNGRRLVPRLVRGSGTSSRARFDFDGEASVEQLTVVQPGVLDSLTVRPGQEPCPSEGQVKIRVRATGLNFRDVLNALGLYPGDPGPLGAECSG